MPYIGPGPLEVELVNVEGWRCGWCGHGDVTIPQVDQLNALIRKLARRTATDIQRLIFDEGAWKAQERTTAS